MVRLDDLRGFSNRTDVMVHCTAPSLLPNLLEVLGASRRFAPARCSGSAPVPGAVPGRGRQAVPPPCPSAVRERRPGAGKEVAAPRGGGHGSGGGIKLPGRQPPRQGKGSTGALHLPPPPLPSRSAVLRRPGLASPPPASAVPAPRQSRRLRSCLRPAHPRRGLCQQSAGMSVGSDS